jgi:hypothetical protein
MRTLRNSGFLFFSCAAFIGLVTAASACSDPATGPTDGGAGDGAADGGGAWPPVDPGAGGILVTVSGEDLASQGYAFGPGAKSEGDPPAFVDGWEVKFEHVIVTYGNIRVNAEPDKDGANPANVGAALASAAGPFAVDLVIGGNIPGKSGSPDEKTIAIAAFPKAAGNFDPSRRYAFSYDTVAASAAARAVNLDAAGIALYETAKNKGYATILQGTATYKGTPAAAGTVFTKMPPIVKFTLGFGNSASYQNCRNTDLQEVGGEFPRGVQTSASKSITAQITFHTDHTFWSKLNVEGTPLHFDVIAAQASTFGAAGPGNVTIDDLAVVDVTGFKVKSGEALPWRSLVPDFTAPAGQSKYDANGTQFTRVNSLASYLSYSAAGGGHMNADGECAIKYNFVP